MLKTYDEFVAEMNFAKFMNHRYEDEVKSSLWEIEGVSFKKGGNFAADGTCVIEEKIVG